MHSPFQSLSKKNPNNPQKRENKPTEKAPAERTDRETLSETEKRDKWRKVQKDATSHQDTADEHRARAKKEGKGQKKRKKN